MCLHGSPLGPQAPLQALQVPLTLRALPSKEREASDNCRNKQIITTG